MKKRHASPFSTLAVCVGLALSSAAMAAGDHAGGHGHGGHGDHHGFVGGAPGKASEVDRTVEIEAGDIYFEPKAITVAPGETVRFVVTNVGQVDHDFTLGTPEVHRAHRQEMLEMMQDGGMDHAAHDDANAVLLRPGETKELIWTFAEAENLEFACNVPGHYQAGMKGGIEISGTDGHGEHHGSEG